jgi:hypothetical protein
MGADRSAAVLAFSASTLTRPKFAALPPLSLYIHIPWCLKKCPYCDFNSHEAREEPPEDAYVDALIADLEYALPSIWGRKVMSIFIGGDAELVPRVRSPSCSRAFARAFRSARRRNHARGESGHVRADEIRRLLRRRSNAAFTRHPEFRRAPPEGAGPRA